MSALWTSDEVQAALTAASITAPFEAEGVTFDSRAVGQGDLFFALSGETTDGHGFVADALSRGAAAAVVSRDVEGARGTLVRVPDTMTALVDLGHAARRRSTARIASVTGSVGKTSTKDALRAMLSPQAPTSASVASYNNHVGVPISLARLPRDAQYGVFEIGHEPSRRDRAAGAPGRSACRHRHQCRAGPYRPHGQRGKRSPTRRAACSLAWRKAQWPCSIATATIMNDWPKKPVISAFPASSASVAMRLRRLVLSPATCRIPAVMLQPCSTVAGSSIGWARLANIGC